MSLSNTAKQSKVVSANGVGKKIAKTCLAVLGAAAMLSSGAVLAQSAAPALAPVGSITDVTVFQVKPDRAEDFLGVMRQNIAHSRTEAGNLRFEVYSVSKPSALTVYVLETWRDADALKVHAKQPTLVALHKVFPTDLIGHPQSSPVDVVSP